MNVQHVRIARPTNRLDEVVAFYRDVLGFDVLARFADHAGFDGVMLGHRGDSMHFEFTTERGVVVETDPSPESLVVLYLDDADWLEAQAKVAAAGVRFVAAHNPYWDRNGVTIEDPDGCRVVLHRGLWNAVPAQSRESPPGTSQHLSA